MSNEEIQNARKAALRAAIQGDNPHPIPLETRIEWLEDDGSAQRTAIIKLERAMEITCKALWALFLLYVLLALAVLT
jgi:hypothetical protein